MRKVLAVISAALVFAAIVFAPAMGFTISTGTKTNYSINSERVNYTIGNGTPAHESSYSDKAERYPTYSIRSKPMPYSIKLEAASTYSVKAWTNAPKTPWTNATKTEYIGGHKSAVLGASERIGTGLKVPTVPENATEQAARHLAKATVTPGKNVTNMTKAAGNVTKLANATATVASAETKPANLTKPAYTSGTAPVAPANMTTLGNVTTLTKGAGNITRKTNVTISVNQTEPAKIAPSTPAVEGSLIVGMVWNDEDGNGIKEANEMGLSGWKIDLAEPANGVINSTTTGQDGIYLFNSMKSGNYTIVEVLPAGWTTVYPTDGKINVSLNNKPSYGNSFAVKKLVAMPDVNQTNTST